MSILTRNVTIKEDEHGLYVPYKPQYPQANMGDKFVIRVPTKRTYFNSTELAEPFKVGEKVTVQEFNTNMGWYKLRRKGETQYDLWNGPRWEVNGFTSCWVAQ